jgi:hypothetical protein
MITENKRSRTRHSKCKLVAKYMPSAYGYTSTGVPGAEEEIQQTDNSDDILKRNDLRHGLPSRTVYGRKYVHGV